MRGATAAKTGASRTAADNAANGSGSTLPPASLSRDTLKHVDTALAAAKGYDLKTLLDRAKDIASLTTQALVAAIALGTVSFGFGAFMTVHGITGGLTLALTGAGLMFGSGAVLGWRARTGGVRAEIALAKAKTDAEISLVEAKARLELIDSETKYIDAVTKALDRLYAKPLAGQTPAERDESLKTLTTARDVASRKLILLLDPESTETDARRSRLAQLDEAEAELAAKNAEVARAAEQQAADAHRRELEPQQVEDQSENRSPSEFQYSHEYRTGSKYIMEPDVIEQEARS